jgi:hypothetical protein
VSICGLVSLQQGLIALHRVAGAGHDFIPIAVFEFARCWIANFGQHGLPSKSSMLLLLVLLCRHGHCRLDTA